MEDCMKKDEEEEENGIREKWASMIRLQENRNSHDMFVYLE